jgi:hypothetical protein
VASAPMIRGGRAPGRVRGRRPRGPAGLFVSNPVAPCDAGAAPAAADRWCQPQPRGRPDPAARSPGTRLGQQVRGEGGVAGGFSSLHGPGGCGSSAHDCPASPTGDGRPPRVVDRWCDRSDHPSWRRAADVRARRPWLPRYRAGPTPSVTSGDRSNEGVPKDALDWCAGQTRTELVRVVGPPSAQ